MSGDVLRAFQGAIVRHERGYAGRAQAVIAEAQRRDAGGLGAPLDHTK